MDDTIIIIMVKDCLVVSLGKAVLLWGMGLTVLSSDSFFFAELLEIVGDKTQEQVRCRSRIGGTQLCVGSPGLCGDGVARSRGRRHRL